MARAPQVCRSNTVIVTLCSFTISLINDTNASRSLISIAAFQGASSSASTYSSSEVKNLTATHLSRTRPCSFTQALALRTSPTSTLTMWASGVLHTDVRKFCQRTNCCLVGETTSRVERDEYHLCKSPFSPAFFFLRRLESSSILCHSRTLLNTLQDFISGRNAPVCI
jgi:hypothetical protein